MSKKPLYLASAASIVADDGPSLRIYMPSRAVGRYPLARIGRIIASQDVSWQAGALTACMHANIPIILLHGNGSVCGLCHGMHGKACTLDEYLHRLLELPDWQPRYRAWLFAEQHRCASHAMQRSAVPVSDSRIQNMDAALCRAIALPEKQMAAMRTAWYGFAVALALEVIEEGGFSVAIQQQRDRGWHLAQDMAGCLIWDMLEYLLQERNRWLKRREGQVRGLSDRALVCAFEQRSSRQRKLLREMMDRFIRWLWEQEPWDNAV